MSQTIYDRLKSLGVTLPQPAVAVANYVPYVQTGSMLYISGQLPTKGGLTIKGCLGHDAQLEKGEEAAKLCAINILAQANAALGGKLERIVRCVKLGGFVASTPAFFEHSKVMNGASDLMVAVLGEAGKHARFAVGVVALPFGAIVEVDAVFEVSP